MTEKIEEASPAEAEALFKFFASTLGEPPEEARRNFNINADGSAAEGGISELGRIGAAAVSSAVRETLMHPEGASSDLPSGRPRRRRPAPAAATSADVTAMLDALGLRSPVRVALRAGAQALAAALNDGDADDEGGVAMGPHGDRVSGEGENRRMTVTLGGEPFVLLRLQEPEDPASPFAALTVLHGGPFDDHEATVRKLLEVALAGWRESVGEESGDESISLREALRQSGASRASFDDFLNQLGIRVDGSGRAVPVASGPSTEAPNGMPDREETRSGDAPASPAAPDGPVRDDDRTEPGSSDSGSGGSSTTTSDDE